MAATSKRVEVIIPHSKWNVLVELSKK
ncbi:hypothetical protein A2U01_0118368, partial [Trifolium medium]|nr:hypothetical protein [Trifolium medium]